MSIPRIRPGCLERSRLLEALDLAMARELTVVCTPAGFGKTTLLADWARRGRRTVAWLSLDPEDNDPFRFWRYVVAALDRAGVDIADRLQSLVDAPMVVSGQGLVTALINDLEALTDEVGLVLDDYHVLGSQSIHDGVAFLLDHLPQRLHVVITSRADPPLPLARLRARDQLAEMRAADLRFTPEESAAFLRDVWGLDPLPAEAVAALDAKTEGWAVGLQLAALSLKERADRDAFLDAFAGTHRYVLDYLSEEVLERQPDRVRSFLFQSSILERLSGQLCNAVTERSDGQEMLEELERANLFVIPLDEERRWYRFHHLFRDLLAARLQRDDPLLIPELHARAAAWCERHGLIDEVIRHALAAGDALWATRVVEQHLHETITRGETVILERWVSALPKEVVQSHPALSFTQGLIQLHLGHVDSVERLLEDAGRAVERRQEQPGVDVPTDAGPVADVQSAIGLLRAELAGDRGDPEAMAEHARSALALMAEDEHGPRFWARLLSGPSADWMRGRLADAERGFAEMLAQGRATPNPNPLMLSSLGLGRVQQARGKLGAALRTHREGLHLATEGGSISTFNAGEAHRGIAQVLYERNELDGALEHVSRSVELGRQMLWFFEQDYRLATLAWVQHARGDADAAIDAMNSIRPNPDIISLWNPAPSERARLLLAQGRVEEAERWTDERSLRADDDVPFSRERDYLVLARVLLARSDPEPALRLLERLDNSAVMQDRKDSLIRIRVLRSLALQATGDHETALAMLAGGFTLARQEGYIRVFADEGPPMAALFRSLIGARQRGRLPALGGGARQHLKRLVRAFAPAVRKEGDAAATRRMPEALTDRELEVLRLIAGGKRNQEIARELVVTLETVKKHVSHIFDKLGAASRTEAVAHARDLGLIS